jgi:8-oxo-dGTP diphosphatase
MSAKSDLQPWPRAAVSTAVFRGGDVLMIERGRGALAGRWSLPGGHIEAGEAVTTAAAREILEETGVTARIDGLVAVHDVILRDADSRLTAHYVLAVHYGSWVAGEPAPMSDAAAARFVPIGDVGSLPLTDGAEALIRAAADLARVRTQG